MEIHNHARPSTESQIGMYVAQTHTHREVQ